MDATEPTTPPTDGADAAELAATEPLEGVSAVDPEVEADEQEDEEDAVISRKRHFQTTTERAEDLDERVAVNDGAQADPAELSQSKKRKKHSGRTNEDREIADENEGEGSPETEQQRRKAELIRKIDAAVKGPKRRPKKKADETDLEQAADDEVERMRQMMIAAAEEDQQAKLDKLPATAKLRLLKEAVETLQKTGYQQAILDNNLLEAVRMWLEPLRADGSLPSLNIQKALFPLLESMYIDTTSLKMSKLGGLKLFYTKKKGVDKSIQRIADRLIESWSRPILKRSSSYRDRLQASREYDAARSRITDEQRAMQVQRAAAESAASQATRRARIPESVTGNAFRFAPASQVSDTMDESQLNKMAERQRINKFKRSMAAAKRA